MINQIKWQGAAPCYCPLCNKTPQLNIDLRGNELFAECCRGKIRTVPMRSEETVKDEWNRIVNVYTIEKATA